MTDHRDKSGYTMSLEPGVLTIASERTVMTVNGRLRPILRIEASRHRGIEVRTIVKVFGFDTLFSFNLKVLLLSPRIPRII